MGYYTSISFSFLKDEKNEGDQYLKELAEATITPDLKDGHAYDKWYNIEGDAIELSKKHPDLLIEVEGEGEESGDIWMMRIRNGVYEEVQADVVYPRFEVLTYDKDASHLTELIRRVRDRASRESADMEDILSKESANGLTLEEAFSAYVRLMESTNLSRYYKPLESLVAKDGSEFPSLVVLIDTDPDLYD